RREEAARLKKLREAEAPSSTNSTSPNGEDRWDKIRREEAARLKKLRETEAPSPSTYAKTKNSENGLSRFQVIFWLILFFATPPSALYFLVSEYESHEATGLFLVFFGCIFLPFGPLILAGVLDRPWSKEAEPLRAFVDRLFELSRIVLLFLLAAGYLLSHA
ncbi:hypothetical protein HKCCSP123_17675, partial [Rhodobacterales bacterium HKCCSP123]|nr:hypothetical protein [Rhodobacterales bacterium HKCCSP123]